MYQKRVLYLFVLTLLGSIDISARTLYGPPLANKEFGISNRFGYRHGTIEAFSQVPPEDGQDIKISQTHQTIVVDKEINFYDDGGPSAKCSAGFKGSITFSPSTPGKKVMMEFKTFDIFNTSSVGYNDIFRVYNGKVASESELQGEYLTNPYILKSWAADGSLTITFEVKTGIPRDGWHIVVKEFTPEPMTVDAADCSQEVKYEAPAGTQNINILKLRITTKNTKDPLVLQSARFTTKGSDNATEDIAMADLWYSGLANDFSKATKVGNSAVNPSGEFTLTSAQTLKEGDNYFWLTYNLSEKATNGHKIDATCDQVLLSGQAVATTSSDPFGNHTVSNIYRMKEGTFTQKISGEWGFSDDNKGSGGKYNGSTKNQVVTFTPTAAGHVIQLDFDKFDLYYSSSSYGAKAQFEVYSGTEVKTSALLWKLDNASKAKVGPGKTLRSNDANGAITILFNAKESASYYTAAGWEARVKEYLPVEMKINSLTADQPTTEAVKPGATDMPLLRICAETVGNLSPIKLESLNINLKGSANAVSKLKVYSTGPSPEFSTTNLWANADKIEDALTLSANSELAEGKNYFWVAIDVAENAKNGTEIDASIISLAYGGKKIEATAGDPDGSRRVVNEYLLAAGVNPTKTIDDFLLFYDDGGKDKNHSNSFDGTVTFVPADPTKSIKIDFTSFNLEKGDKFEVFAGKEVNSEKLISVLFGDKPPRAIVSTSDDGALTIHFKSDKSVNKPGWEASVSTTIPQPLKITQVSASQPNTNTIVRGSKDELLLKVVATADGDKGVISLDQLSLNLTNSAAIESIKVYYTNNNDFFATTNQLSSAVPVNGDKVDIHIGQKIGKAESYYYWIVADTKVTAAPNSAIDASLTAATGSEGNLTVKDGNPEGDRKIVGGAKGSFTIGSSSNANFKTFTDAVNSIKDGVEGDVTFTVEPGEYNEIVTVPHINGATENARITFKSQTDNASDVKVKFDSYKEPEYGKDPYGVFNIAGADFISIENISISTEDPKFEAVAYISNISKNVTIKGCSISAKMTTSFSEDIALVKTKANNLEGQNNDNLTLENNNLTGGYIGFYVGGTGYVGLTKEKGATIRNNRLTDQGSKSIYITDEEGATIEGNIIKNYSTTKSGFQGMDFYRLVGSSLISKNAINIAKAPGAKGIECRPIQNDRGQALICNNLISIVGNNSNETGILLNSDCYGVGLLYNTISISGKAADSRSFSVEGRSQSLINNVRIANNLFQNSAGGSSIYILKDGYQNGIVFENNAYYSSASTLAKVGSVAVTSYNDWSSKAADTKSIEKKAEFYSEEDLHLKSADGFSIAIPIDVVKTDFDGDTRSNDKPFVGADEYNAPDQMAPALLEGYPKIKNLTHIKANALIKSNESGKCFYLLTDGKAEIPAQLVLKEKGSAATLTAKQELDIKLDELDENKEYLLAFVLEDVFGNISDVQKLPFKTLFRPTEISTFEKQEENAADVTDGTSRFVGFKVVKGDGAKGSSTFARYDSKASASITILNTDKGIAVNGFFIRSALPITYWGIKADGSKTPSKTISSEKWTYACLFDLGEISSVEFDAAAAFDIDNFSDKPEALYYNGKYEYSALQNERFTLKADFAGGANPIAVTWFDTKNQKKYTGDVLDIIPQATGKFTVSATDAFGQTSSAEIILTVEGIADVATFEDLNLAPESRWWGYDNASEISDYFYSGSYKFNNFLKKEWSTWSGFGYSNFTSTEFTGNFMLEQFRSAAGHGAKNSKTYGVVYPFGFSTRIEATNKPDGDIISGTYVTNTAWVASVIRNGDSMTGEPFKAGDWFKVVATGYDATGAQTSTSEFYLADYRSPDAKDHKLFTDWTWWDLSALGKVKTIGFKVEGSRSNSYGLTIPAYFCIDNFNGPDKAPYVANPIVKQQPKAKDKVLTLDLSNVFADDDAPAGSTITLEVISNSNVELAQASIAEKMLTVNLTSKKKGAATITLKATSEGKSVEHTFVIERLDEAPYVTNPIPNQKVFKKNQVLYFDLKTVFADDDAPEDNIISYELVKNSNEALCSSQIQDGRLSISFKDLEEGTGTITIKATSEECGVLHTFDVEKAITSKIIPEIKWVAPSSITYGTTLNNEHLNASTNVAGSITYLPTIGSLLPVGKHVIKAIFTPKDPESVEFATQEILITVEKVQLTISKPNIVTAKLIDGNNKAIINSLGKLNGVISMDNENVTVTANAFFDDANIGSNKTITISYTIAGSASANYIAPLNDIITGASISNPIVISKGTEVNMAGCEGNQIAIHYSLTSGTPYEYKIRYAEDAHIAGFKDLEYQLVEANHVYLPIPEKATDGTFHAFLQFRDINGFESNSIPFEFTINVSADAIVTKFGNVVLVDNSSNRYNGYQWFKDGSAITGATQQYYKDPNGLNGTYHVRLTTTTGHIVNTCSKSLAIKKTESSSISVYPNPVQTGVPFTVMLKGIDISLLHGAVLDITNAQGITVCSLHKVEENNKILLSGSNGIYLGRVVLSNGEKLTFKIILAN
ncbi:DUF4465 domain-containing protein [Alistipes sp. ZOR0009]|uniref:DUF4465 domain-containing protein n=1 Tax=Alistipes sp. ZOR0009 TaxID=1339253 RepID=UPI00068926DC|nr:DUF4465 domain-containing protein [Alistipes sp. ZOR0009]